MNFNHFKAVKVLEMPNSVYVYLNFVTKISHNIHYSIVYKLQINLKHLRLQTC